jgi:hypothetical protein
VRKSVDHGSLKVSDKSKTTSFHNAR